jgi:hypothetical protein
VWSCILWYKPPDVEGIVSEPGTWFSDALVRAHYVLAAVLLA